MAATQEQKEIWKKQWDQCVEFFNLVAKELQDTHVIVPSKSKRWPSMCLVEKGQEKQISYYGKPVNSLRVAPNWNWRAGVDRCSNIHYIQCVTPDLPFARRRPEGHSQWASLPILANMVGYFDTDNKYHCVFGEKYNPEDKSWSWVDNFPGRIALMIKSKMDELHASMDQKG